VEIAAYGATRLVPTWTARAESEDTPIVEADASAVYTLEPIRVE
jgi:hypothetical protein